MTPDILILSPEGEQALLNADAGGVFIRPRSFAVGDYAGTEPATPPGALLGNVLATGRIHYIEVANKRTARFTLVVPKHTGATMNITEAVIYLNDGTLLGRARFSTAITKNPNRASMIEVLLVLTTDLAHRIDVTLSEFGSIPSVPNVDYLPPASDSIANAVIVLDGALNPDNTTSPDLAMRYGPGGNQWGFTGYNHIFSGPAGPNITNTALFANPAIINQFNLAAGTPLIININGGPGAGETRKFYVTNDLRFAATNTGFSALAPNSNIQMWMPKSVGSGQSLPSRDGIPEDWMLVAGDAIDGPMWSAPSSGVGKTRGNLYHPPGKLKASALTINQVESSRTFVLFNEDPMTAGVDENQMRLYSYRRNNNYAIISLGGVCQHRTSFAIDSNVIEFSEMVPVEAALDARLFELTPHSGAFMRIVSSEVVGDGSTRIFDLPAPVENVNYTLAFVSRILTATSSYAIDIINNRLIFSEPPLIGTVMELNSMTFEDIAGYSTQIYTKKIKITDLTNIIYLPVVPLNKDMVFVNQSGAHYYKSGYTLVGNKLIFGQNLFPGDSLEIMIFHNVRAEGSADTALRGMVIDAISTSKGYELIRQNAESIRLPYQEITFRQGPGIRITGEYPDYQIESTVTEKLTSESYKVINVVERTDSSLELALSYRIEFNSDVLVHLTADFEARLGPGFKSKTGLERIEFVLSERTLGTKEADFGRDQAGSGESGFCVTAENTNTVAKANASQGKSFRIVASNYKQKFVEVVAKVRISDASTDIQSFLKITLNGIVVPVIR